jgi:mannose-6-phosphate isomerase-like protein (cupin superfamily)
MDLKLKQCLEALRASAKTAEPFFLKDLPSLARTNKDFRRVVYTGKKLQFTLMSIPPKGEVGKETHLHVEQTFHCVEGAGTTKINNLSYPFKSGDVLVVPQGNEHNITNTGTKPLKLYSSYSPPNHLPHVVHHTKRDADTDKADEAFGNKVR